MNAIVQTSETGHSSDQFGQLITIVDRLVANPDLDLERVERFLVMARELRAEQAEVSFNTDLSLLQAAIPKIDQTGYNTNTKSSYAKAADVMEPIRPVLAQHGFSISFKTETLKDAVSVTAILRHCNGHKESNTVTLPIDTGPGRNTVQAIGSSLEYASRYAANKLLNITSRKDDGSDDDGNGTSESAAKAEAMRQINMAGSVADLMKWKADHYEGVVNLVSSKEADEIVSLWNMRKRKIRDRETAQAAQ
ncbi:MAG TPA: ERF family protein [Asticcacaulis sp.]|nr:ERF family protein [Asticcacaulis sp.]